MSAQRKRVAIIGAGASGLTGIKCCLDEDIIPVCFERTEELGGLWRYTEKTSEGQACVMKSTVINTSKEMMAYSDFPIPEEAPVFMHNREVYEYFKQYADAFGLRKYISFHTEVVSLKRSEDYSKTGQWVIHLRNIQTKEEKVEVFDGVLVCSGHHADKYDPDFPGLKNFKGQVTHSHEYRHPKGMEDKRVLIIGIGNSGGDMAVELSRIASQVLLSTRRGTWMYHRIADHGYPLDMIYQNRPTKSLMNLVGDRLSNQILMYIMNQHFNHDLYGLSPDYMPNQQHPMINDELPNRIICGSVKIKTDIKCFTETGVEFVDGSKEDNIDVVFKATGYSFGFPFIEKEVIDVKENHMELYQYMYPPDLEHSTLAVIGCFQPLGSVMPISELQCRLATRVLKGLAKLPSREEQWKDIRYKEAEMAKKFVKSRRHTIQIDYIPFSDQLARLIGCMPNYTSILLKDPFLGSKMIFGPVTPYHYRVQGPGKWDGARKAIMTQWDRIENPLKTRKIPKHHSGSGLIWKLTAAAVVFCILVQFIFY